MKVTLEQLKAIPILEVATGLGIEVRGKRMHCFSRYHEDRKTPSLNFNLERNYFNCFGCEIGGSNIDLIMAYRECDRSTAIKWLTQEFCLSPFVARRHRQANIARDVKRNSLQKSISKGKSDPEIYRWILDQSKLPYEASKYLMGRGLSKTTIKKFKLCGSLEPKRLIQSAEKRFGRERIEKAGLLSKGKHATELWPVWWEPIVIIPFYWRDDSPIYLQARRLINENRRKYIGLFGIAKPLFNAQIMQELAIGHSIYIVEGAMDVMSAYEVGIYAIGVLGAATKFKVKWSQALKRFNVIILPDHDKAGNRFKDRVVATFASIGKSVQVQYLPKEFKDITDALKAIKESKL